MALNFINCSADFKGDGKSPELFESTYPYLDSVGLKDSDIIFCLDEVELASDGSRAEMESSADIATVVADDEYEHTYLPCDFTSGTLPTPGDLQAALDLKASTYSTDSVIILLGKGSHATSSTTSAGEFSLTADHSNLTIIGIDKTTSIITTTETRNEAHTLNLWGGVNNVKFENLTIAGNGSAMSPSAADGDHDEAGNLGILDAGNVTLENVVLTDSYYQGIFIAEANSVNLSNVEISNLKKGLAPYDTAIAIWNQGSDLYLGSELDLSDGTADVGIVNLGDTTDFDSDSITFSNFAVAAILNFGIDEVNLSATTFGSTTTMDMFSQDAASVTINAISGASKFVGCQTDTDPSDSDEDATAGDSLFTITGSTIDTFYFGTVEVASDSAINTVYATAMTDLTSTPYTTYSANSFGCDWINF